MLNLLARGLKALNSDANPNQIALAIVFGAMMGLTPLYYPHNALLLFLVLLIRVNYACFLISLTLFSLIAYAIDPLSHQLGLLLLNADSLKTLWTTMYGMPIWRLLAFNNTLVIGSVIFALILSPVLFFIARWVVLNYREHFLNWVKSTRLIMWLTGTRFFSIYSALTE